MFVSITALDDLKIKNINELPLKKQILNILLQAAEQEPARN